MPYLHRASCLFRTRQAPPARCPGLLPGYAPPATRPGQGAPGYAPRAKSVVFFSGAGLARESLQSSGASGSSRFEPLIARA
jgi:hypothetical protein